MLVYGVTQLFKRHIFCLLLETASIGGGWGCHAGWISVDKRGLQVHPLIKGDSEEFNSRIPRKGHVVELKW